MIVVMQCAGRKQPGAGHMLTADGQKVQFVAHPSCAPPSELVYARPEDTSDSGVPWRTLLLRYNASPRNNPLALLRAFELYENDVYRRLATHVGIENFFILSAGWGLIPASFLTPNYDITFKPKNGEEYKRRRKSDCFRDFQMLPTDTKRHLIFFGSKEYLPFFLSLTEDLSVSKIVFYRSDAQPETPGCRLIRYQTGRSTNWQYECADAFIKGDLEIRFSC